MSEREWKPGDVAIWDVGDGQTEVIYYHLRGDNYDVPEWRTADSGCGYPRPEQLRRAAVIDPDNHEQVERLILALPEVADWLFARPVDEEDPDSPLKVDDRVADDFQAALREFANPTPPKPDEPQGLGAVVVAGDGREWIHHGHGKWMRDDACVLPWDSLRIVRIVSEGVVA